MELLLQDVRYAIRLLFKRPLFTTVAVVTLALGIGANTAIFSVVDAVLLAPLAYTEPERLMMIWGINSSANADQQPASVPDFDDLKAQSQTFDEIAASRSQAFNLTDGDEPERVGGARVTVNMFSALAVKPVVGRDFLESEGLAGAEPVVILSHSLWQQRYGSDPAIVGRALNVDGKSYTVVGVLPKGIHYPAQDTNLYVPFIPQPNEILRGARFLRVIGRLKKDVSPAEALAEMETIAGRVAAAYPATNTGWGIYLVPLHEQIVGRVRPALIVLLSAVGCVLLIACANVANLLLARAAARRAEFAIRAALGASRWQLVRQLLTESLVLSALGGMFGLLLAMWGVPFLTGISASSIPRVEGIGINLRVLGFTAIVSLATGAVFGLAPALRSSSKQLTDALREGRRGSTGSILHQRLLSALVVSEVAIAMVLLVVAGLMIRSFLSISNVAPGFNPKGVITLGVGLPLSRYPGVQQQAIFYDKLVAQVRTLPGVESAASVIRLPMLGFNASTGFTVQGKPVQPGTEPNADYRAVTDDYFRTMAIPLLKGRDFTIRDSKDAPDAMIINEMLADRFFPGEDPVGKRIQIFPDPTRWREIVGVVGNVRLTGLDAETNPTIYVPYSQNPYPAALRNVFLVARTSSDPQSLVASIRSELKSLDKDIPVSQVQTMEEVISGSLAQRRLSMSLLIVFAALAAGLSAVGIYGVMAYIVAQRTHEIGIRMAMGAEQKDVIKMVLGDGAKLTFAGIGAGLAVAVSLTRFLQSLLYQVSATDTVIYASIVLLLTVVALLASYIPARRAAKIDPMEALRCD
ncbi:MAG TPA: ABC transporter permease [Blastocatellia bacterium]|nr:ABC transporter permease [Blastocatellia bacterium]